MPSEEPANEPPAETQPRKSRPALRFLLRGLAISLPPILTIWILAWIVGVINNFVLAPTSSVVRYAIVQFTDESLPRDQFQSPEPWMPKLNHCDGNYLVTSTTRDELTKLRDGAAQSTRKLEDELKAVAYVPFGDRAVPYADYAEVALNLGSKEMPRTSRGIYMELVATRYFRSRLVFTAAAVILALVMLYFIGRMVNARVGVWMIQKVETRVLARVPLVNQVYSSVKQVTDFFFTERKVEYNRVVAVEYPRRGMWSIGFVTSDSFLELSAAVGEPLVCVLMPTSPMPMTGFTISVPRSDVIDLDVTVDQAFQFCLSCGVLVPAQQKVTPEALRLALAKHLSSGASEPVQNVTESDQPGNVSSAETGTTEAGAAT